MQEPHDLYARVPPLCVGFCLVLFGFGLVLKYDTYDDSRYDYMSMHRQKLEYVVSTQYMGADRMMAAVNKFNDENGKNVRFVEVASEAPNMNNWFFEFVEHVGADFDQAK